MLTAGTDEVGTTNKAGPMTATYNELGPTETTTYNKLGLAETAADNKLGSAETARDNESGLAEWRWTTSWV